MTDATDPGAQQARIEGLEAELQRIRAEFATFSSRLSHDMQGILRNIQGFGQVLQEQAGAKLAPQEARLLQRMLAGAQRGDSLMRDLALLSAAAVAPLQPYGVDLRALLDECIRDLAPALEGRAVLWNLAPAPWPRIEADPALLRLALGHLLANAAKFTRGREPARIGIELLAMPDEWVLTVADNGAGFDAAYVERLFQPFERLHLASEFEGNGVGLALVKLVAGRHRGRVRAEALPEAGARFTLALPRQLPPAVHAVSARERAPAAGAARKLRILVVDDEPLVLATVTLILERQGHAVVRAASGEAALQVLRQEAEQAGGFDVVISDWLMPGVGGAEVVLSAKAFQPTVRTIVLTGQRPGNPRGTELPPAVDHVIAKPVSAAALRSAVQA
jgi:CheY-like chemotaxis protein/nitrogen-specific signal transduction histidine kinase